jgi:hypothetical protein
MTSLRSMTNDPVIARTAVIELCSSEVMPRSGVIAHD